MTKVEFFVPPMLVYVKGRRISLCIRFSFIFVESFILVD